MSICVFNFFEMNIKIYIIDYGKYVNYFDINILFFKKQSFLEVYVFLRRGIGIIWIELVYIFNLMSSCELSYFGFMKFGLLKLLSVYFDRNIVNQLNK